MFWTSRPACSVSPHCVYDLAEEMRGKWLWQQPSVLVQEVEHVDAFQQFPLHTHHALLVLADAASAWSRRCRRCNLERDALVHTTMMMCLSSTNTSNSCTICGCLASLA